MGAVAPPAVGTLTAVIAALVAGVQLTGWWWPVALAAGAGACSGRGGALLHAVATLALAGGAAAHDATWLVPLLVLGLFASVEGSALPVRRTRARPSVPVGPATAATVTAAGIAAAVVALSAVAPSAAVPTALAAALAALALLAALRT